MLRVATVVDFLPNCVMMYFCHRSLVNEFRCGLLRPRSHLTYFMYPFQFIFFVTGLRLLRPRWERYAFIKSHKSASTWLYFVLIMLGGICIFCALAGGKMSIV